MACGCTPLETLGDTLASHTLPAVANNDTEPTVAGTGCFTSTISFNSPNNSVRNDHYSYFVDEETEAQRGKVTKPDYSHFDRSLLLIMSGAPMTPRTLDPHPVTHGCLAFKGTWAILSSVF